MLAERRNLRLLVLGASGAALTAALTFATAARSPEPVPVAVAASSGFLAFSIAVVWENAASGLRGSAERVRLLGGTWLPWVIGAALSALSLRIETANPWLTAVVRTGAIAIGFAPALFVFGRGIGLRELVSRTSRT
jgi:hypothetical protein